MNARYLYRGDMIDYVPEADVAAGEIVIVNDLLGIAKLDIKAGTLGALSLSGVYEVTKATGAVTSIAFGKNAYWTGTVATTAADDGAETNPVAYRFLGKVVHAAAENDTTVRVRLG